jgi:hypothetical protein
MPILKVTLTGPLRVRMSVPCRLRRIRSPMPIYSWVCGAAKLLDDSRAESITIRILRSFCMLNGVVLGASDDSSIWGHKPNMRGSPRNTAHACAPHSVTCGGSAVSSERFNRTTRLRQPDFTARLFRLRVSCRARRPTDRTNLCPR